MVDSGDSTYKIHSAYMEFVMNPEGYCITQIINLDVDETEYDEDYGLAVTTNQKIYAKVSLHNPGQPVDLVIPPADGYEEIYALQ